MDIDAAVRYYEKDLIEAVKRIVAIRSVEGEPKDGMPFGEGPAKALHEALDIAREMGFEKVVNVDNYAGYVEIGEGDDLIGILGHLDVVPEGEGWTHDPFGCEIEDGWIYGRGVTDDKGPVMTALYALRIIEDFGIPLNKRIRLVMGTNEETGMGGVKYYKEKLGGFTLGFTPDADFPLIYGEKGHFGADFSGNLSSEGAVRILSLTGGEARNVVARKCVARIECGDDLCLRERLDAFCKDNGCTYELVREGDVSQITIIGRSAHASMPELGLNAISLMMKFLGTVIEGCPFVNGYNKAVGMSTDGDLLGIKYEDEYGPLTFNNGVISTQRDRALGTIDIRYPLTTEDFGPYVEKMRQTLAEAGLSLDSVADTKPLFVDPESDLVQSLYSAYREITGDEVHKPFTIGGGTYAKAFENIVAFGIEYPDGGPYDIHSADEKANLEEMKMTLKILVKAIMNLLEL